MKIFSIRNKAVVEKFIYPFLEVLIFTLIMFFYTTHSVLLAEPSKLYSTELAHRLQTNALLHGQLALSPHPFGAPTYDYIWTGHGLQQNWGLGVPLLRLPFEWGAKQFGFDSFPDRLTLLFYLLLMIILLNVALRLSLRSLGITVNSAIGVFIRWYLIAWVMFSPGLGYLIQNDINVYKETILYGYIYSHLLLALLLIYILRPFNQIFFVLCLASGFAWMIRATLILYGLMTVIIAIFYAYQKTRKIRFMIMGISCFCLGIGLDLWFNYLRFGSMLEFGPSGLIGHNPTGLYSLYFNYPFQHEPFFSAARELFGRLFFNNLGQSHTFRDREFSGVVFNISHLVVLGMGLISFLIILKDKFSINKINNVRFKIIFSLLSWGTICFWLLFFSYLYFVAMQTRYLCDFSTAFDAIMMGIILLGISSVPFSRGWGWNSGFLASFFLMTALLFYFNDNGFFKFDYSLYKKHHNTLFDNKENMEKRVNSFNAESSRNPNIPEILYCSHRYFIPIYDGFAGWEILKDCSVRVVTGLFLPARKCLTVNYSIDNQRSLPPIQVKRDLEFIKLIDTQVDDKDFRIPYKKYVTQTFCSDRNITNQIAFYNIGWVKTDKLKNNNILPITLNWVYVSDSPRCEAREMFSK